MKRIIRPGICVLIFTVLISFTSCSMDEIMVKRVPNPNNTTAAEIYWNPGSAVNTEFFRVRLTPMNGQAESQDIYLSYHVECDAEWFGDNQLLITVYEENPEISKEKILLTDYQGIKISYIHQPYRQPPLYDYDKLLDLLKKGQKAVPAE